MAPLFDQFTRPLLKSGTEAASHTEIDDRRGHLSEALKLRRAATRFGYQRGNAADGGRFGDYVKRCVAYLAP